MNTLKHGPSLAYWKFLGPNGLQDPILLCDDHAADRIAAGLKLAGYLAVDDPGERVCLDCAKAVDIRPGEQLPLPTLEAFFADEDDES